jgi:glycine/D-amino acid oxidase-like deaminating enzyme
LKLYQSRSYVLAFKGAENVHGMYIDEANGGLSFRNYGDILLLGGNGHRTGKKSSGWEKLSDFTEKYYPNATETARWATKDCMTLDGVPYIGKYSQKLGEIYVATGFNKWGMTSGMVSAMIISDMILGRENTYKEIFSPSRSSIRPQLALNIFEATANLLRPTTPRCPHMGCALLWNKQEKTWDCPCHGSRFTSKGKVIDNPATGDMKLK